jgi:hypothetical protein
VAMTVLAIFRVVPLVRPWQQPWSIITAIS